MKKIAAVTLLILVNTALSFIMYLLMVLSLIECISPLMILLLFAGHIFAAAVVQWIFERHRFLSKPAFWLCAGVLGLAASILLFAVGVNLNPENEMGTNALLFYFPFYAVAFCAVLGLVLLIKRLFTRNRPEKEKI